MFAAGVGTFTMLDFSYCLACPIVCWRNGEKLFLEGVFLTFIVCFQSLHLKICFYDFGDF